MSTDTSRKIETLRRWAKSKDEPYLADIADEMERIMNLMVSARVCLREIRESAPPSFPPFLMQRINQTYDY